MLVADHINILLKGEFFHLLLFGGFCLSLVKTIASVKSTMRVPNYIEMTAGAYVRPTW